MSGCAVSLMLPWEEKKDNGIPVLSRSAEPWRVRGGNRLFYSHSFSFSPSFFLPRATVFEKRDKNAQQSTEGAPLTDSHFDLLGLIFMNVFIHFDLPWNSCFLGRVCQLRIL